MPKKGKEEPPQQFENPVLEMSDPGNRKKMTKKKDKKLSSKDLKLRELGFEGVGGEDQEQAIIEKLTDRC